MDVSHKLVMADGVNWSSMFQKLIRKNLFTKLDMLTSKNFANYGV